MKTLFHQNSS
uniref:Similar to Histidine acid phosphatase n=1 Tax=Arundo donax TaxID=35708 RepID=A0A0A9ETF0_ARUDO